MKKNHNRKPKVRPVQAASAGAAVAARAQPAEAKDTHTERKVGVVSGTPADAFDETSERRHDKIVAIYISVLAVLLAIAATGSNDAMKNAQQAGFGVGDTYAFYQAKTIRQSQIKLASDALQLKAAETPHIETMPENARKLLQTNKADYDKEVARLETNGRNGKKELLAKAEACDNERKIALAQHPFYDYSMAMFQIAIVLASASIIMGTRALLYGSWGVGIFGVLLFLNGFTLVYGGPELKHDKQAELEKAGVHIHLKCVEE
jgi:hypothetical protein